MTQDSPAARNVSNIYAMSFKPSSQVRYDYDTISFAGAVRNYELLRESISCGSVRFS